MLLPEKREGRGALRFARVLKMRGLLAIFAATLLPGLATAQVSFDQILSAEKEPRNWLSYSGSPMCQRHSALVQVTPENGKNLEQ